MEENWATTGTITKIPTRVLATLPNPTPTHPTHNPRGGGGGTLIFSYVRRLGSFFGVKILNFNIFGGFQKNKYLFGYKDFVDIFLASSLNWTIFRGQFYAFYGLFLRSRYRIGDIFRVAKISNIFLRCLKFLLFFRGER